MIRSSRKQDLRALLYMSDAAEKAGDSQFGADPPAGSEMLTTFGWDFLSDRARCGMGACPN